MFAVRTFKGVELNLELYKGSTVRSYEMELLEDDCSAMDLSIYDQIEIKIYSKRGGTVLEEYSIGNGIEFNSPEDNFIYWTAGDFNDLPRLEYYIDGKGILASGQKDLLFYGISDLK